MHQGFEDEQYFELLKIERSRLWEYSMTDLLILITMAKKMQ